MACFTAGTLIATARGEVPVERLKLGDHVMTRDNGLQQLRWTGQRILTRQDLRAQPALRPVRISRAVLGNPQPGAALVVSPRHRVLLANERNTRLFHDREVLVAAGHLLGRPGVDQPEVSEVTYVHFLLDRHEIVLSNGLWSESFLPGAASLQGLPADQRDEILTLFPDLGVNCANRFFDPARRILNPEDIIRLIRCDIGELQSLRAV